MHITDALCSVSVAISRLHNLLALFPDLLSLPKGRDAAFSAVASLTAGIEAPSPSDSSLHSLYQDALLDLLISLSPFFTPSQRATLLSLTRTFHYTAVSRAALVDVKERYYEEDRFSCLRLSPHHLTFPSFEHQRAAVAQRSPPRSAAEGRREVRLPLAHLPRLACPSCHRLQPFYCTHCYCVVHPLAAPAVPRVRFPFHLHVVLHPDFDRTKSTALHARLLCEPGAVSVHLFPHLPAFPPHTLLLFPSSSATPFSSITARATSSSSPSQAQLVLLEGTWPQAQAIADHSRLRALPAVRLAFVSTSFWRYQRHGEGFLSSIEAVHALAKEWVQMQVQSGGEGERGEPKGKGAEFDDLLWLFALGWRRVRDYHASQQRLLPPALGAAREKSALAPLHFDARLSTLGAVS